MNAICLSVFVALIVVVVADHSQHGTVSKPGDVVHWTTSNSKGAATLNSTLNAKQELGAKATTTAATVAETTVTPVAVPATAAVNATKLDDAAPVAATSVAAAPSKEAAKDIPNAEASTTPAAATPEVKEAKPTEPKVTHK